MSTDRDLAWLQTRKTRLLEAVAAAETGGRTPATTPGGWSLLDIANHLMRVEEYAARQLRANRDSTRRRSLRDRLRFTFVSAVLASPIKVAVPLRAVDPASHPITLPALTTTWAALRSELRDTLAALTSTQKRTCYLVHPYAGHMTMANGLAFLVRHWRSHERQIRSLEGAGARLP